MASIDGPRPLWQPATSSLFFYIVLVYILAINSVCVCMVDVYQPDTSLVDGLL